MREQNETVPARLTHERDEVQELAQDARRIIAYSHDLIARRQYLHECLRNISERVAASIRRASRA